MLNPFGQYQTFSSRFSQQLESLRGVSAIIVLFSHCFQAFIAPFDLTFYSFIRLLGQAAVMMFFVLSGFLIGHSIQKNIKQFGKFNIKYYAKQRCKRILLPFVFALSLTAILYGLAPVFFASKNHDFENIFGMMIRHDYSIQFTDFIGSIFFLNGFISDTISANASLWSLSYEVWFYVLAGFLPFLIYSTRAVWFFLTILVTLSLLNLQFFIYFLVWLIAFSCSFQYVQHILLAYAQNLKRLCIFMAIIIAGFDAYQFQIIYQATQYTTENFTIFNVCVGIALACWLIQLQYQHNNYPTIWVKSADFSYTLYITHFPLLLFILGCFPHLLDRLDIAIFGLISSMLFLVLFAFFTAKFLEPMRKTT